MVSIVFATVFWGFFVLGAGALVFTVAKGVVRRVQHRRNDWPEAPTSGHVRLPGAAGFAKVGRWNEPDTRI